MKAAVNIRVTTARTVKLFVQTASTANLASPGHANTTSTEMEPVMKPANRTPEYVNGAMEAFLKACFQMTELVSHALRAGELDELGVENFEHRGAH